MSLAVDEQSVTGVGVGRPLADDSLQSLARSRGIDPCLQCEATGGLQQRAVWNHYIGARVEFLFAAGITAIDSCLDVLLFEAWSVGIRVSVNQTDYVHLVVGLSSTDHEADCLARRNAQEVRISCQSLHFPDRVPSGYRRQEKQEGENEKELSCAESGFSSCLASVGFRCGHTKSPLSCVVQQPESLRGYRRS